MYTLTLLLVLVLGCALGSAVTRAMLWWRTHQVRTAEATLQRRRIELEARRVGWARHRARQELARV